MARPLHHVTHAVHRLDQLADVYVRLGFQVGGRNRHSWGTHNQIVQLPGFYVELLQVAEPQKITPHAGRSFSFGAYNRDFLAHTEGLAMLALASDDASSDAEAFRACGVGDFDVLDFERASQQRDGSTAKVAFSLAFAANPKAPDIGLFTCQEHFPENFWHPAAQVHPNTATQIAGIVLVAENPSDHRIVLSAFTDQRNLRTTAAGITIGMPHGDIQVIDPAAFASHFGVAAPDMSGGARLAAMRFAVRDFAAAMAALQTARVTASVRAGRIVVGPDVAAGATIVFEQG